ncbi:MAG TPA: LysE family transporter [Solirubrobacteraceae bacterium]|nr:LysE family transporter [Solirubrobacteraceae bacterium]
MHAILIGFGFGFLVAMQLGPMSLFLVRSTLAGGWSVGIAIGAGIAIIDAGYALGGAAGAAPLLTIDALRAVIGVVGSVLLLALGVRMLHGAVRPAGAGAVRPEVASPRRAFVIALAATAANPATIVSWAAVFAAIGAAGAGHAVPLLVAGVGLGSLVWMTLLTTGTTLVRRAAGRRAIRVADAIAGTGLVVFAAVLAAQSLAL